MSGLDLERLCSVTAAGLWRAVRPQGGVSAATCRHELAFVRVLLLAGALLGAGAPPTRAEGVPSDAIGLWSYGGCGEAPTHILLNQALAMVFETQAAATHVAIGPVRWTRGTAVLDRPEGVAVLPALDALERCEALPPELYAGMGEALALLQAYDTLFSNCSDATVERCAQSIFAMLDVSKDDQLSAAEVGRGLRGFGVLVAYEAVLADRARQPNGDGPRLWVEFDELSGRSMPTSLAGSAVADGLVGSFDYDANGFLSLDELLQDRGPVGTMNISGTLATTAAYGVLQTLLRGLPDLAGNASNASN